MIVMIMLVIATEAVTEIIVASKLTAPFRDWWKKLTYPPDVPRPSSVYQSFRVWFDSLITCGYCTSVWVAGAAAIFAPRMFELILVNWIIMTFVVHRLSNWLHVVFELVRRGRVKSFEITILGESDGVGFSGESSGA